MFSAAKHGNVLPHTIPVAFETQVAFHMKLKTVEGSRVKSEHVYNASHIWTVAKSERTFKHLNSLNISSFDM